MNCSIQRASSRWIGTPSGPRCARLGGLGAYAWVAFARAPGWPVRGAPFRASPGRAPDHVCTVPLGRVRTVLVARAPLAAGPQARATVHWAALAALSARPVLDAPHSSLVHNSSSWPLWPRRACALGCTWLHSLRSTLPSGSVLGAPHSSLVGAHTLAGRTPWSGAHLGRAHTSLKLGPCSVHTPRSSSDLVRCTRLGRARTVFGAHTAHTLVELGPRSVRMPWSSSDLGRCARLGRARTTVSAHALVEQ